MKLRRSGKAETSLELQEVRFWVKGVKIVKQALIIVKNGLQSCDRVLPEKWRSGEVHFVFGSWKGRFLALWSDFSWFLLKTRNFWTSLRNDLAAWFDETMIFIEFWM